MKLTRNFALEEFACRDGACVPNDLVANVSRLAAQLQALRDHLGMPIVITSGYRTPEWNAGRGVSRSRHLTAEAADFRVKGVDVVDLARAVDELVAARRMRPGGIGLYLPREGRQLGWLHYDIGPARRWKG